MNQRVDDPIAELKDEALLDYYREAVRACYGDEIADVSTLIHNHGWYYIDMAHRTPDGGVWSHLGIRPEARRAVHVREMAEKLLRRAREK